jgi:hypothetical protein
MAKTHYFHGSQAGPYGDKTEHLEQLDPAADDSVFPLDTTRPLGVRLRPDTGHRLRWRGQLYPLRFGDVELVLADDASVCRCQRWWLSSQPQSATRFSARPVVCSSSTSGSLALTGWPNLTRTVRTRAPARDRRPRRRRRVSSLGLLGPMAWRNQFAKVTRLSTSAAGQCGGIGNEAVQVGSVHVLQPSARARKSARSKRPRSLAAYRSRHVR